MALGKNLRKFRKDKGLSQDALSARTNGKVSQGAISALEKRDSSASEHATDLAKALGISLSELLTGEKEEKSAFFHEEPRATYGNIGEKIPLGGRVPLISFVAAGNWGTVVDNFEPGIADDWLSCPVKHSDETFALKVRGVSMHNPGGEQSFSEGDIIFVDPHVEVRHRHLVVAKLRDNQESTFKRLLIDGDKYYLEALNPDWKPRYQEIDANCKIVGVVIAQTKSFI